MHDLLLYACTAWMTLLLGVAVIQAIRAPSLLDQVLALDTAILVLVAILTLFSQIHDSPYYLDAALVLALLSFVATLVAARYRVERRIF